jgi:hypothetical protein
MVLGSLALRNGDTDGAVDHLRAASRAPASEELIYGRAVAAWRLLSDLLDAGRREPVLEFLDRMAAINLTNPREPRDLAEAIRRGETPKFPHWTRAL